MKASRLSSILFGSVLLCSAPVFAGNTVKKSLDISETVSVNGTQLRPGTYKFEWSGTGPDVQVTISQKKETVATVPAHLVQANAPNGQTGYGLKTGPNGEKDLSEIFFDGGKYDLQLQAGNGSQTGGGSGSQQ